LWTTAATAAGAVGRVSLGLFLSLILNMLGQAIVVHAAFQDMRNRPVSLGESLQAALRRLLSIIGLAVCVAIAFIVVFAVPATVAGLFARTHLYVALAVAVPIGIGLAALLLTMWLRHPHVWSSGRDRYRACAAAASSQEATAGKSLGWFCCFLLWQP
jgi:hypothetical protein